MYTLFGCDDLCIGTTFKASASAASANTNRCISELKYWNRSNYLLLNPNKIELLVLETDFRLLRRFEPIPAKVTIGAEKIEAESSIKLLGVKLDSLFSAIAGVQPTFTIN